MDQRDYALSILKQARDLLSDRLIESIAESADGILEDAEGCSYMGEIEVIQEKIGGRLNQINMLIANFPVGGQADQEPTPVAQVAPAPTSAPVAAEVPGPEKFALFSQQIAANDLESAGETLADLLEVDQTTGIRCATSFRERLRADPTTIQKAMLLRNKLMTGKNNDSLMILWECFRLQGLQAVEVLQTLKTRLSTV